VLENSNKIEVYELVFSRKKPLQYYIDVRALTGPGIPGKSWNVILAFSRTAKSWKINAGPGKSWKSINSCRKVFFKKNCLQYYFWIFIS